MKRTERAGLLLSIVERLAQDDWPTIDLIVGQFEGRRSDEWQGSKAAYIGWSLEGITDEALRDLGDFLFSGTPGVSHFELGVLEELDAN